MASKTDLTPHAENREALEAKVREALDLDSAALTKRTVDGVLNSLADLLAENAQNEGFYLRTPVAIFTVQKYDERTGRNPKTGDSVTIPAKYRVKFKLTKRLKDAGE